MNDPLKSKLHVYEFKVYRYTFIFLHIFSKGDNFWDVLFASMMNVALPKLD